jgi:stage III sporulation protein AF
VIAVISFLREWVLNIITLVIFIVLLEILIPSGKMKKYVNLVSGFILLIAIINPFVKLVRKDIDFKAFYIQNSNYMDRKDIEAKSKVLEEQQLKQITEVYRNKIIRQLEDNVKEIKGIKEVGADVLINEDYTSQSFGEIKRVYLYLKLLGTTDAIKPVTRVEKVVIGKNAKPPGKDDGKGSIDQNMRSEIKKNVNKILGVNKEDVVITLQES